MSDLGGFGGFGGGFLVVVLFPRLQISEDQRYKTENLLDETAKVAQTMKRLVDIDSDYCCYGWYVCGPYYFGAPFYGADRRLSCWIHRWTVCT